MARERRLTESEWRDLDDLRKHWMVFCDCDAFDGSDTFIERMETRGYARLRTATKRDYENIPFAAEKGITPGGRLWELTKKGERAFAATQPPPEA